MKTRHSIAFFFLLSVLPLAAKDYNTAKLNESRLQRAEEARYALPEQRLLAIRECGLGRLYFCQRSLIENLQDPDIEIRTKSAYSLGLLGQEISVDYLKTLLDKESEKLKELQKDWPTKTAEQQEEFRLTRQEIYETLWAVGFIKSPKSKDVLLPYLAWEGEDFAPVRRGAASALDSLGDPASGEDIKKHLEIEKKDIIRLELYRALFQFEPTNYQYKMEVVNLLKSDEKWVRYHSAKAIHDFHIKEGFKPLEKAMLIEEDPSVRETLHQAYMILFYY